VLSILENLSALSQASKFLKFINGTDVTLPNNKKVFIKVKTTQRLNFRTGLRFSKYSFKTEAQSDHLTERGYGEGNSKLLAVEKSISEAVERLIFRILKNDGQGTQTSSGWAAHVSRYQSERAAFEELAERDAIMVHWLEKRPMIEVDPKTFPISIKKWVKNELALHPKFGRLRVLATVDCFCPTVTTVLQTETGHSVMSHATAENLMTAYRKAMTETCRLASNIDHLHFFETSQNLLHGATLPRTNPEDHAMVYAYHEVLPYWLFGDLEAWAALEKEWKSCVQLNKNDKPKFSFHEIVKSPLSIGYCESDNLQKLFFGSTKIALEGGKINLNRLNLGRGASDLNLMPHFIS
jgi:hypothetical protein